MDAGRRLEVSLLLLSLIAALLGQAAAEALVLLTGLRRPASPLAAAAAAGPACKQP